MKKRIISIFIILIFAVSLAGCGCQEPTIKIGLRLEVWGVNDDADSYEEIFKNYVKINPRVKQIAYRKFSADTYKQELIDALASGKGPDIFMINSTWEPSFRNKIVPAPAEIISEKMYRDNFVDLASDAFIVQGKIYAAPLSVDSLALYYNKDLFAEAGIATPPKTWDNLVSLIPSLTKIDSNGQVKQSAIAMGTAYNINRSTDILGLLMLQEKTQMTERDGEKILFTGDGEGIAPAVKALQFYTDFAKRSSNAYTWNSGLHWSLDAFAEGSVAMMLNYSWHMETIRSKSPKLNFTVAAVPQIPDYPKVDFGNCYGYVVALNKKPEIIGAEPGKATVKDQSRINETWKFLKYLTLGSTDSNSAVVKESDLTGKFNEGLNPTRVYLENTNKPAARKDLIDSQKDTYELGVFAQQNLIARSWKQIAPDAIEVIMGEMIDDVNRGKALAGDAIKTTVTRISQAIKK